MIIEKVQRAGKTYFIIRDFDALRVLFGQLLGEVQRIKSEGDFEGARKLIETYGVNVDRRLHREVLTRYEALGVAPYAGFINPEYRLGRTRWKKLSMSESLIPTNFLGQMMG